MAKKKGKTVRGKKQRRRGKDVIVLTLENAASYVFGNEGIPPHLSALLDEDPKEVPEKIAKGLDENGVFTPGDQKTLTLAFRKIGSQTLRIKPLKVLEYIEDILGRKKAGAPPPPPWHSGSRKKKK